MIEMIKMKYIPNLYQHTNIYCSTKPNELTFQVTLKFLSFWVIDEILFLFQHFYEQM